MVMPEATVGLGPRPVGVIMQEQRYPCRISTIIGGGEGGQRRIYLAGFLETTSYSSLARFAALVDLHVGILNAFNVIIGLRAIEKRLICS